MYYVHNANANAYKSVASISSIFKILLYITLTSSGIATPIRLFNLDIASKEIIDYALSTIVCKYTYHKILHEIPPREIWFPPILKFKIVPVLKSL